MTPSGYPGIELFHVFRKVRISFLRKASFTRRQIHSLLSWRLPPMNMIISLRERCFYHARGPSGTSPLRTDCCVQIRHQKLCLIHTSVDSRIQSRCLSETVHGCAFSHSSVKLVSAKRFRGKETLAARSTLRIWVDKPISRRDVAETHWPFLV